jgi:3-hydroxy-9,10-secoandrosta-1,3,5(10)-triene-9,17-dione monooxygenase
MFGEQAQVAAFGGGEVRLPGRPPMGTAIRVDRGWLINGRWDFCSGAPYATHFLPGVLIQREDGPPISGTALVARDQWTMLDDWGAILGMLGSGSNSIVIENQIVPEHNVVPRDLLWTDTAEPPPGWEIYRNPAYNGRGLTLLISTISAFSVGCARGALDEYEEMMRTRRTIGPNPVWRVQVHEYQQALGLALGLVDAAEAAMVHAADEHLERCRRHLQGEQEFSMAEDFRHSMRFVHAADQAWRALLLLFESFGTTGARDGHRMQRYFRDLATIRTHVGSQTRALAKSSARLYFGLAERYPE